MRRNDPFHIKRASSLSAPQAFPNSPSHVSFLSGAGLLAGLLKGHCRIGPFLPAGPLHPGIAWRCICKFMSGSIMVKLSMEAPSGAVGL